MANIFCLSQSLFRLIIHFSLYVSHFNICNIDNRWGERHRSSIKRKTDKRKYSILNLWMWTERTWVLLKSSDKPFHIPCLIRDLSRCGLIPPGGRDVHSVGSDNLLAHYLQKWICVHTLTGLPGKYYQSWKD